MEHVTSLQPPTRSALESRARHLLQRWAHVTPQLFELTADALAVVLVVAVFYVLRMRDSSASELMQRPEVFLTVLGVALVYWLGLFWLGGLYRNWLVRSPFEEAYTVLKVAVVGGAIPLLAILIDGGWLSYKLILFVVLLTVAVIALRYAARRLQLLLRQRGLIVFPTLLVGDKEGLAEYARAIAQSRQLGYIPLGVVTEAADDLPLDVPAVGTLDRFDELCRSLQPQVCILAFRNASGDRLMELVSCAADCGASVMIVPDLYHVFMGLVRTLPLYGVPLIEINPYLLKPWQAVVKRAMDIVISATVLVVGMPLWLLIALAIKLDSPGPVLFSQYRVGRGNKPFKLYKFRSMYHGGRWDGTWTRVGDPRVTRVGYVLRRTRLDEIPQLWNVLKGEMSLVGPRPEQVSCVEEFTRHIPYYPRRHVVRPGITGWWQIHSARAYPEDILEEIRSRLRDDFYYIENMSLRLDLEILLRTIGVMLRGRGVA